MKAVNLIPVEERRGGSGTPGKSGGAVYALLGALALLVVVVGALTIIGKTVDDRRTELAGLEQQVAAEQTRAAELQAYTAFRTLSQKRYQTVSSLAASRFDWGAALHEISRVVPKDVWLTQLSATAAPGVQVGAGSGSGNLRSALPVPAIEITGCTTSQPAVARTMAAMRRIDGVARVSLASSEKADVGGGTGSSGGTGSTDCRQGRAKFPQFSLVVFFDAPAGALPVTPGAPGAAPASAVPAPGAGPTGAAGPSATSAVAPGAPTGAAGTTVGQLTGGQSTKDAALTEEEGK